MKILQLIIHDPNGNEIRNIQLKEKGLTLVYGNVKKPEDNKSTINSLGKTLLLKMLDYILGCKNDDKRMNKIYGYQLTASVFYHNEEYIVKRKITNKSKELLSINGKEYSLEEYKKFFGIQRSMIDKQVLLSRKNSDFSPRENVNKTDFEVILQMLSLRDLGCQIAQIYSLQDELKDLKKQMKQLEKQFSNLKITGKNLEESIYFIEKEIEKLKNALKIVSQQIEKMDTIKLKKDILQEYEEKNRSFKMILNHNFKIENEIERLNRYLNEMKAEHISTSQLQNIFSKAKVDVPELVYRKLDEVEQFHQLVFIERTAKIHDELKKLKKEYDNNVVKNERLSQRLDELSSIIAENKAYREALVIYQDYNQQLQHLIFHRGQLSNAKLVHEKIINNQSELTLAYSAAMEMMNNSNHLIAQYRDFIYDLAKKIYNSEVSTFFDISLNDRHETTRPLKFVLNMRGETGEGISEVRKNMFDYLVFRSNHELDYMIQDSSCYNGIDPRQVTNMLIELNQIAETTDKQAIVAINEYQLDVSRRDIIETFFDGDFGIKLDEEDKLLKMNF